MRLFGRNRPPRSSGERPPLDSRYQEAGVHFKDLMLLQQLVDAGADLSLPRHVVYFVYFDDPSRAEQAVGRADAAGYRARSTALPGAYAGTWSLNADIITVLDPAAVVAADELFTSVAGELGGEYDGWEASVYSMNTLPVD
jgi:hypothetical protein